MPVLSELFHCVCNVFHHRGRPAAAWTDDLVWQYRNGQVHYWPMQNGRRVTGRNIHTPVGPGWSRKGVGDVG